MTDSLRPTVADTNWTCKQTQELGKITSCMSSLAIQCSMSHHLIWVNFVSQSSTTFIKESAQKIGWAKKFDAHHPRAHPIIPNQVAMLN